MERQRIIDIRTNTFLREMAPQRIAAVRNANNVLIISMPSAQPLDGHHHVLANIALGEETIVVRRIRSSPLGPAIKVRKLDPKHGPLEPVEPGIQSDILVKILLLRAMDPKGPQFARESIVV